MVDTGDLKSLASNGVPVRVRPRVVLFVSGLCAFKIANP
jgi:hypothetical protein